MGLCMCLSKFVTALVLLGINFVLVLGGAFVLYIGLSLRDDGWVEVLKGYWSGTNGVLTAIITVGIVVIVLAVLGSIAACCRWRLGLLVYAWVVFLLLLVFLAVAIAAFTVRGTVSDWADLTYPASDNEVEVKDKFDEVYCYAQGEYMCNSMPVTDVLEMFVPSITSAVAALFANYSGINALCNSTSASTFETVLPELQTVCDSCEVAEQFSNLSSIVDWANDKCPRTNATLVWCGEYLSAGNSSTGTAPYTECREEFLSFVESRTLWTGVGGVLVVAGALMVIGFSCFLRRRERRHRHDVEGAAPIAASMSPPPSNAVHGRYDKA